MKLNKCSKTFSKGQHPPTGATNRLQLTRHLFWFLISENENNYMKNENKYLNSTSNKHHKNAHFLVDSKGWPSFIILIIGNYQIMLLQRRPSNAQHFDYNNPLNCFPSQSRVYRLRLDKTNVTLFQINYKMVTTFTAHQNNVWHAITLKQFSLKRKLGKHLAWAPFNYYNPHRFKPQIHLNLCTYILKYKKGIVYIML